MWFIYKVQYRGIAISYWKENVINVYEKIIYDPEQWQRHVHIIKNYNKHPFCVIET